jgi:sterol O-acyltransferase
MELRTRRKEETQTSQTSPQTSPQTSLLKVNQETKTPSDAGKKKTLFLARESMLSLENLHANKNEFRGIMSLFWLVMICYFVNNLFTHDWLEWTHYYEVLFKDSLGVLVTDLCLIAFAYTSVILQKLVLAKIVGSFGATVLKHVLQSTLIFTAVYVATVRDWPWIQRTFLVPHAVVLFMKMHSFLTSHHDYYFVDKIDASKYVTFSNFTMYLLFPTFVYELEYPRKEHIRWHYVFKKTFSALCILSLMSITHQKQIQPTLDLIPNLNIVQLIVRLMLPFLLLWGMSRLWYLLMNSTYQPILLVIAFFLIFDCIALFFAEITRFADRQFYEDWWNRYCY